MTNSPTNSASSPNAAAKPQTADETKQIMLKEIGAKWNKFSEQDHLVAQVVAKYGLEKVQAQREVDTLLKGRQI